MKVGADQYTMRHQAAGKTGVDVVEAMASQELEGLQFGTVARLSPTMDAGELAEVKAQAEQHSMYLEGGLPRFSATRPSEELLSAGEGDLVAGIRIHLNAIRRVLTGSNTVRAFVAGPGDRGDGGAEWSGEMASVRDVLVSVGPMLRDLGLRIALENHGEATTGELIWLAEQVGLDACGVCLDTGNLVLTLEDPVTAASTAAPYSFATHLKDGVVATSADGKGFVFQARPCGEGVIGVERILDILQSADAPVSAITVEDHDGLYPIPTHDRSFVEGIWPARGVDATAISRLADEAMRLMSWGVLPSLEEADSLPWAEQAPDRVRRGVGFVRTSLEGWRQET